jgi:hypothetical protein
MRRAFFIYPSSLAVWGVGVYFPSHGSFIPDL